MRGVYVGLGSNLDQPHEQLRVALKALDGVDDTRVLRVSRAYRTPPWGMTEQPDFLNAVAELETALSPEMLVAELLRIERAVGRRRDEVRWGPRRIDLDLLLHGDVVLDAPGCHVPHPRLRDRAFVLVPLAELAPTLHVPGLGSVRSLLEALPAEQIAAVRADESALEPATFRGK